MVGILSENVKDPSNRGSDRPTAILELKNKMKD